jgi:hypothetical protein
MPRSTEEWLILRSATGRRFPSRDHGQLHKTRKTCKFSVSTGSLCGIAEEPFARLKRTSHLPTLLCAACDEFLWTRFQLSWQSRRVWQKTWRRSRGITLRKLVQALGPIAHKHVLRRGSILANVPTAGHSTGRNSARFSRARLRSIFGVKRANVRPMVAAQRKTHKDTNFLSR